MRHFSNLKFWSILLLNTIGLTSYAVTLSEAIVKKMVRVEARWKTHTNTPLDLTLHNLTEKPITVEVQPGTYFRCADDLAQNMLVMKSYQFVIPYFGKTKKGLSVNCMEKHDYGPHDRAEFYFMGNAETPLHTLASQIAKSSKYEYISQSLVWALADKDPEFIYSKGDSVQFWPVLRAASPYIHLVHFQGYSSAYMAPTPRITFSSRVNMTSYVAPNSHLTLVSLDKEGKVVKEFYKNKPVDHGFYSVTIGFNEIVSDSNFSVQYKLTDTRGTVLLSKNAKNNLLEEETKVYWLSTIWEMNIENPVKKANLKLYGPDGALLFVLYENKDLSPAIRRTPFGFYHTYGKNSTFKVKLTDGQGALVKEIEIDGANSSEPKMKTTKKEY